MMTKSEIAIIALLVVTCGLIVGAMVHQGTECRGRGGVLVRGPLWMECVATPESR